MAELSELVAGGEVEGGDDKGGNADHDEDDVEHGVLLRDGVDAPVGASKRASAERNGRAPCTAISAQRHRNLKLI
jgi:hypothetical protein